MKYMKIVWQLKCDIWKYILWWLRGWQTSKHLTMSSNWIPNLYHLWTEMIALSWDYGVWITKDTTYEEYLTLYGMWTMSFA